ncbi:hypothetical protein [Streptomyces sp. SP18CS02]|uniref:hypothetical protein n=1 Tax=Streptomyces sp. SP18CS02 TaxID=3002531 RepID=UPI003FCC6868
MTGPTGAGLRMRVVVDAEERVRAFPPHLGEVVARGLVVLDRCRVVRYGGRETDG